MGYATVYTNGRASDLYVLSLSGAGTAIPPPGELGGVTKIAAGFYHSCAATSAGAVKCWGSGSNGEIGDNSIARRLTAVSASGFTGGAADVATGAFHTCALTTEGAVKCWGYNIAGQLGDNSTTTRMTPVDVWGLAGGVARIQAGDSHTCALTTTGGVKCWGENSAGQLGDGGNARRLVPGDVAGLATGVVAIATSEGARHTCALTTSGRLKCWGLNSSGQLGDNTTLNRLTPVDVVGLADVVAAVAVGKNHTCVLTTSGGVKCWGDNSYGQLGDSSTVRRVTPTDVQGLASGVTAIAAGNHTCVITVNGAMQCWGNNEFGQLGDGTSATRLIPVQVRELASAVGAIAAGTSHTCVMTTSGGAKCWGNNDRGQLGDNTYFSRRVPLPVLTFGTPGLPTGVDAVSGDGHTTISFTAPMDDGGSAITGYTAICNAGGFTAMAVASPITVTGLANGTTYACAVAATNPVGMGGPSPTVNVTPSSTTASQSLSTSLAALDFGGQSTGISSPPRQVVVTNKGSTAVDISKITVSVPSLPAPFAQVNDCTTLASGANCTITLTFSPPLMTGALNSTKSVSGTLTVAGNAPGVPTTLALIGTAEKSLVTHYYQSILRRGPDSSGKTFWEGEAARMVALGGNVNETWFAMAMSFYFSLEYTAYNRDDGGFVTDLYSTFFNRAPDSGGLAFWTAQIASGMPREVVLVSFMFSNEFARFAETAFGNIAARAEINLVVDFYRGLLARLPDSAGFTYWLQQFRVAQCSGAAEVNAQAESISSAYALSQEYLGRKRTHAQYVGDLYNAMLRRGGDLPGVQFWINELATGNRTREKVRQEFISQREFQSRVASVVAQGCLQ